MIPETYRNQDWPRKVSREFRKLSNNAFVERSQAFSSSSTLNAGTTVALVDCAGGAVTITLPPAALSENRTVAVKKVDVSANALTIDGNGVETIDGAPTLATAVAYTAYRLHCDGNEWWIL